MHELAISRAILDTALRHAEGRPVTAISLRVGAMRQVVPDSLEFYLGIACRETPAEGAELEVEVVEALMRCTACSQEWEPAPFGCPACGEPGEVVAGEELEVDSITIEEGAPAGAASG